MPTNLTSPHTTKKGTGGRGIHARERFFFFWSSSVVLFFLPPSMTSLQQTLKPSLHIHISLFSPPPACQSISFYCTFLSSSASIQPPASLSFSSHLYKIIFTTCRPSLPPSILLLLPLLPSINQSQSTWQSNSCPLTSSITVYQWLFPVWWCRLMGKS